MHLALSVLDPQGVGEARVEVAPLAVEREDIAVRSSSALLPKNVDLVASTLRFD